MRLNRPVPRAVLDTNVLLDLWLFDDAAARPLRAAIEAGRVGVVRSAGCDTEFAEVLGREQFALEAAERSALIGRWSALGEQIAAGATAPLVCGDPDDQKFLDVAFAARADLLFTRDRALLRLAWKARALGLRIVRPAEAITYDPLRDPSVDPAVAPPVDPQDCPQCDRQVDAAGHARPPRAPASSAPTPR